MKIITPIKSIEELNPLLEAGADEFYCGVLTNDWLKKYSNIIPINKRGRHGNFKSFEDLRKVLQKTSKKIALTLNMPFYSEDQISDVKSYIKQASDIGIKTFIISDPWLLDFLKDFEIHISAISAILNNNTIEFFKQNNASRIILSRDFNLKELLEIANNSNGIEIEAFALNDGCKNVDGLCTFFHGIHDWDENYFGCMLEYSCNSKNKIKAKQFERRLNASRFYSCNCAGCNVKDMQNSGITHLKISGRQLSQEKKIKDVKFLKSLISFTGSNFKEFAQSKYKTIYKKPCIPSDCYY